MLRFDLASPVRSPQWRHERVLSMIHHRPRPLRPTRDDDHPIRICRMLYLEHADTVAGRDVSHPIGDRYPALTQAHQWHYSADVETKQIIQARLLTDEPFESIAQRFAADAKAVEYFEQLFFDVRDRLDRPDWITKIIKDGGEPFGSASSGDRQLAGRGFVYRLVAYTYGAAALDEYLAALASAPVVNESGNAATDANTRKFLKAKALMALATLEINATTAPRLIKLAFQLQREEAKQPAASPADDPAAKILAALKKSSPHFFSARAK